MPGPATIIREAHRLRRHAKDLQTRIEQGPRMLKAYQANVVKQEEGLQQAHETIKRLKVSIHEKEVSLKATRQQAAKYEKQLNTAESKKEYDALKIEIANAQNQAQRLEDDTLNAMMDMEERSAQVPQLEQTV